MGGNGGDSLAWPWGGVGLGGRREGDKGGVRGNPRQVGQGF